jgi:hypothetical protein
MTFYFYAIEIQAFWIQSRRPRQLKEHFDVGRFILRVHREVQALANIGLGQWHMRRGKISIPPEGDRVETVLADHGE